MTETHEELQAKLAEARRKEILDAAARVIAMSGYHKTTIKQIAKEARVADGTIYNYFANKEELLLGLLDRLNESEQRQAHFASAQPGDIKAFFVGYVRHRLQLMQQNMGLFRVILPELLTNQALRERYLTNIVGPSFTIAESYFQGLQTFGVIKPINLQLAVRVMAGTFLGLLFFYAMSEPQTAAQWEQLPEVSAEILWSGLQNTTVASK
jgi:TetR/AcrR family fatty acid metabolism transcriptional regulator